MAGEPGLRVAIRPSRIDDGDALDRLYRAAFADEDLTGVVSALTPDRRDVLALVAEGGGALAGHVAFTACRPPNAAARVSMLAPLAVAPALQRRGIGGALIRAGCDALRAQGVGVVLVFGDPAFYSRFGFIAEDAILPPFGPQPHWDGAWRSLRLRDDVGDLSGRIAAPPPWDDEALWTI